MELSGIAKYLAIYREKLFSAEDQKRFICGVIFRVSGVVVDEKDLTINHTTISIHTDSVTRHQLFLYKQKILEEIKNTSKKIITDLR